MSIDIIDGMIYGTKEEIENLINEIQTEIYIDDEDYNIFEESFENDIYCLILFSKKEDVIHYFQEKIRHEFNEFNDSIEENSYIEGFEKLGEEVGKKWL